MFNATGLTGTMAALFNVQGVVQVDDGGTLEVVGATNATTLIGNVSGQINIGGMGAGGTIKLDGSDAAFSVADFGVPGGTVTLSDNSNNLISGVTGTETLINDIGETLSGAGTIKNLAFANFGTTIANGINPLLIAPNSGGFTNTGTVTVDAGSFLGLDATASATAGTNGLTNGGTISVAGGAVLAFTDSSKSPSTETLVNDGAIDVGGDVRLLGAQGEIEFFGGQNTFDLTGTGSINFSDGSNNAIKGSTGTENVVIESGEALQGSATISNLSLTNDGTIIAGPMAPLVIKPNVNGETFSGLAAGSFGFENIGSVQVELGGDLVLDTTASQAASQAPVINAGTITVNDGGRVEVIGAADKTVSLGNLDFFGAGINIGGAGFGGVLEFDGSGATFDLNDTGATLGGEPFPGTLALSDNSGNLITDVTGIETLVNDMGETISGAGTIENLGLVNKGTIIADGTSALEIAPNAGGFTNSGTVQVNSGSTLAVNLAQTAGGPGFSNAGTVNVQDGGTLEFSDLNPDTNTVNINNFQGSINLGQSTGATLLLDGIGSADTFHLFADNGILSLGGAITMVNSAIEGVSGGESLVLDFGDTIEGTDQITNLNLTSALSNFSSIIANGGTLAINAHLTNLSNGTLNGGVYQAGDTAPGILQLPGDVTTNSAFIDLFGKGSEITDPAGHNALSGLASNQGCSFGIFNGASLDIMGKFTNNGVFGNSFLTTAVGNEATLAIGGNLTNFSIISTEAVGATPAGSAINVGGTLINSGNAEVNLFVSGDTLTVGSFKNAANVFVTSVATLTVAPGGSYTQTTNVYGTLMSPSITVTGGTLASGRSIIKTKALTSGALITADFTSFIGVRSGSFTAANGYQQLANGTLDELIAGKTAFGVIDVSGPAGLDGTLDVTLESGFIPTVGDQFAFLDFTPGDLTGTFANFLGQTFDNDLEKWGIEYNNTGGAIVLVAESATTSPTPEPGSLLLLGTGLLGVAFLIRRKNTAMVSGFTGCGKTLDFMLPYDILPPGWMMPQGGGTDARTRCSANGDV